MIEHSHVMRSLSLAFLGLRLFLPVTLITAGLGGALDQAIATRAVCVQARILDREVVSTTAVHSARMATTSFRPVVRYSYDWNGREYRNDRVTFLDRDGDRAWAEATAHAYEPGDVVTAFVLPDRPERSFLLRQFRVTPYALLLAALPLLVFWDFVRRRIRERWTVPPASGRLQVVEPGWSMPVLASAWLVIGAFAVVHGLIHLPRAPEALEVTVLLGYVLLGIPLIVQALRTRRRRRTLGPPVVEVLAPAHPGGDLRVDVEQGVRRTLDLGAWRLRARCEETSRPGVAVHQPGLERRTVFEETRELAGGRQLQPDEALRASVAFTLPPGVPSTSHPAQGTPRWDWTVELELVTRDRSRLTSTCPVQVGDVAAPRPREW